MIDVRIEEQDFQKSQSGTNYSASLKPNEKRYLNFQDFRKVFQVDKMSEY